MDASDYKLMRSQTAVQQALLLQMSRGFRWWFAGTVPADRAEALLEKLDGRYGVLGSPMTRSRRRVAGLDTATVLMHPVAQGHRFNFWLLSPRELPGENMHDGWSVERADRLLWEEKYQLVQLPKKGGPTWTWRLQKPYRDGWAQRVIEVARRSNVKEASSVIAALMVLPLWAGVRGDVIGLLEKGARIWQSAHRQDPKVAEAVTWPKRRQVPAMTRVTAYDDPPTTLGLWLAAYRQRLRTVDLERKDGPNLPRSLTQRKRHAPREEAGHADSQPQHQGAGGAEGQDRQRDGEG